LPLGDLEGQIALGKLELVRIESRDFIELEALKAYANKRKPSAWNRVDDWRKQEQVSKWNPHNDYQ
jgi:hypothetical protein